MQIPRIGHGYDVHALADNRALILGGVTVPFEKGLAGHSDADVLTHAIMDSLLGALSWGDIGQWFPDNDPAYEGADSLKLLATIVQKTAGKGIVIGNIDATIVAQRPKLAPYLPQMRKNLSEVLRIPEERVSVKATTEEHLGFTGEGLGIAAHAVCIVFQP